MSLTSRFLMSSAQHRAQAERLRRGGTSELCTLAAHHERLAAIIERREAETSTGVAEALVKLELS